MSGRKLRIFSVVAVLVLGSILIWRNTASKLEGPEISQDALGQGLVDRWNAGLPAGYEAETADDLDRGHLYARLTYGAEQGEALEGTWEPVTDAVWDAFASVTAAHAALPDLDAAHAALLAEAPSSPGDGWTGGLLTGEDGARIALVFDPAAGVLYAAEEQPAA